MTSSTARGVPFPNVDGTDANNYPVHMQALAQWLNDNPGVKVVTPTQRDALTGADLWSGRTILNSSTGRLERYTGTAWTPLSTVTHSELAGLAGDDHTQYHNDARHDTSARHAIGTTIPTGAPTSSAVGDSVATGSAASVARSDHKHGREAFSTAGPPGSSPGTSSSVGTSASPARSDHAHGLAAAAPGGSRVGDATGTGTSTSVARADHQHSREAFGSVSSASAYGLAASSGTAITVSHSDHVHGTPALPSPADIGAAPSSRTATRAHATASRGFASNSLAKVSFDAVDYLNTEPGASPGSWSNSVYTVGQAGLYLVTGRVQITTVGASSRVLSAIFLNNNTVTRGDDVNGLASGITATSRLSDVLLLNAGDTVQLMFLQTNASSAIASTTATTETGTVFLALTRLGA